MMEKITPVSTFDSDGIFFDLLKNPEVEFG